MNKTDRIDEVEGTYGRDNGSELGPVGIVMVFLLMAALCPVLLWEAVKWFVLAGWASVKTKLIHEKRHRDRAGLAKAALQSLRR
jgi:hypothetical protein